MCVQLEDTDTPGAVLTSRVMGCRAFEFVVCTIIIGMFCLLGLAGNVTSFMVLTKHKTETSTIFLLQCLALSDSLLLGITLVVYSLPGIYPYTHTMKALYDACDEIKTYVWPISMVAHTTTIWLTVLVTFTRYRSVCTPTKRNPTNPIATVRLHAFLLAVVAVIYNIPRFFEHSELWRENYDSFSNNTNGSFNLGDSKIYQIIYSNILYFPVMYIIPLFSLAYMNTVLIRTIGAIRTRRESLTGHKCRRDYITHCIIIIVCVFIVCQTPALINQIFWAVTSNEDRQCGRFHFYYTKISDVLIVINSSTNFIVYCLFGRSFRKIFMETLCVKKICGKRMQKNSNTASEQPLDDICALCKNFREDVLISTGDSGGCGGGNDRYIESSRCSCKLLTNGAPTKSTNVEHDRLMMDVVNSRGNTLLVPREPCHITSELGR